MTSPARRALAVLSVSVSPALPAAAQQFQHQVNLLPGVARWSEGVEAADVDRDGDIDLFFADGEGFSSAGVKRQNVLLINQFVPSGTLSFADESVARLGSRVSNAKGVATGDVNGDGWIDALYCNAFDTDVPFLYINQGAANPGFFAMESATRGLVTPISSGSAQFGDLDDDGDLDLVINDAYLGSGSRRPKVYFNDGNGVFSESLPAMAAAPTKSAQMDVQLADLDNDWDLDFVGFCRATNGGTNHHLLLNSGNGVFQSASPIVVPSNSAATYEGEVGDLDGDSDLDLFLVSSASFAEGAIRNNLAPSGSFSLTALPTVNDANDDNEIVLFDYDVDGDYDALVGSLSNTREVLWTNNGAGAFTNAGAGVITTVSDPTLDATVADLDNDGRYDIVTAQGEGSPAAWANKVYRNTGVADTRKPDFTALDVPALAPPAGPFKVRAKLRDQVLDDGLNFVTASARYVIRTANAALQSVSIDAGGLSAPAVSIAAGGLVRFGNTLAAPQTVQFTSAPYDHALPALAQSQSLEYALVHPGLYTYTVLPAGFAGSINVTGSDTTVAATYSGGQLYRFLMSDTAAGAGRALVFELVATDWAGNTRVTATRTIPLVDCGVTNYCTAKTNSLGCVPAISASGTASTTAGSGFVIQAAQLLNQKAGLLVYSLNGAAAVPFQGGTLCVAAPRMRTPPGWSGGTAVGSDCSGVLALDFNSYMANTTSVPFVVGATVTGQFWSRDPADPFSTSLSDALRFGLCQ